MKKIHKNEFLIVSKWAPKFSKKKHVAHNIPDGSPEKNKKLDSYQKIQMLDKKLWVYIVEFFMLYKKK